MLREAGYSCAVDPAEKAAGRIVIAVQYPHDGKYHILTARFPDHYPYLPLELFGLTLPPGKHICPSSGILCLMQDLQSNWKPSDTLAGMLARQVPGIIQAHLDPENADEAQEGTQRSGQYPYHEGAVFLTEDWDIPKEHSFGRILIGLEPERPGQASLRGAVLEVLDSQGVVLARLDPEVATRYQTKIPGRWVRVGSPPSSEAPYTQAIKIVSSVAQPKFNHNMDVVGLLFQEESSIGNMVENWLFAIRLNNKIHAIQPLLARSESISRANLLARVETLGPLVNKKVFIVGLGSIGSMIAWQLARAGIGSLTLLDQDFVQVGNIPRWQIGLPAVGRSKAEALARNLKTNYPFVNITSHNHKIGSTNPNDMDILATSLQEADLVIDATAEICVTHLLSDLCHTQGISFLWATGTPGCYGGVVGRVIPGKTAGCWFCYQSQMMDGDIIPPVMENRPGIQPKGCFHPTFTGTGFDMDEISLAAVRLATGTLCDGVANAYPNVGWNVGVVNLRCQDGGLITPQWTTYDLSCHPHCPKHG